MSTMETEDQTTRPETFADFLLARIAEDEARADEIHDYDCGALDTLQYYGADFKQDRWRPWCCGYPARVLVECEAKRRIVEIHVEIDEEYTNPRIRCCQECSAYGEYPTPFPCSTLKAVANIYADHECFQEEWRP